MSDKFEGAILTIDDKDNTKFHIKAGSGEVLDDSDPENPVWIPISWEDSTHSLDELDPENIVRVPVDEVTKKSD